MSNRERILTVNKGREILRERRAAGYRIGLIRIASDVIAQRVYIHTAHCTFGMPRRKALKHWGMQLRIRVQTEKERT